MKRDVVALGAFVGLVVAALACVAAYHHGRLSARDAGCAVETNAVTGTCSVRCPL